MSDKKKPSKWPLFLIGASAAVAVWSGWVGLGELTGFGPVHLLPGIWNSLVINTAITLPIGVEAYGATALGAWLDPRTPKAARKFARRSAIGALSLGMLGQVAYHLLSAYHYHAAPWWIVMLVSCLPVITLGFASALHHLRNIEDEPEPELETHPTVAVELPPVAPEPAKEDLFAPAHPPTQANKVLPPAPWDDQNWTPPQPVFTPVEGPETGEYPVQQPLGTVNVRSPLSRAERKVPVYDRVPRTGSFQAIE